MIDFDCASCGKHYQVSDALAGKQGRCKQCGEVMRIPAAPPVAAAPVVAAPVVAAPVVAPPAASVQNVQVVVNQVDRKSANGLGVAGVILGLLALVVGWIPLLGTIAVPGVLLGGLLSLVGLIVAVSSRRSGIGWPIAGMAVNAAALVVVVAVNLLILGATASSLRAVQEANRKAEAQAAARLKLNPPPPVVQPGVDNGGNQP